MVECETRLVVNKKGTLMSQGKLKTDTAKLRGQAGDRYSDVAKFLQIWRLLSIISAIGWALTCMFLSDQGVLDKASTITLVFTGFIYVYFLYSIVNFVKPLVDAAVNSYVNEELLKENTEYLRQLLEIEKFKLKDNGQNPSE